MSTGRKLVLLLSSETKLCQTDVKPGQENSDISQRDSVP